MFETCSSTWRGLGEIPGSGYRIREEYAEFDAMRRFAPEVEPTVEHKGCRCGDVLRGVMPPNECPLFRTVCSPEKPCRPVHGVKRGEAARRTTAITERARRCSFARIDGTGVNRRN